MMTEKKKKLAALFKTKPTKCEVVDPDPIVVHFTVVVYFGDICIKGRVKETGCCMGRTFRWSLDCQISENGGKDYTPYRSYPITESLQSNKEIPLKQLLGQCKL